jgi:cytochrome c oxidase assembly factor CtaG
VGSLASGQKGSLKNMIIFSIFGVGFIPLLIISLVFLFASSKEAKENNLPMNLKKVYLYLVSFVALVIAVIGSIILLNFGLKSLILTDFNHGGYELRDLPTALSMLIVATPVWFFHWRLAKQEV